MHRFSGKTSIGAHLLILLMKYVVRARVNFPYSSYCFPPCNVKFIDTRVTIKFPQLATINTHTICVMQFK